MDDYGHGTMTTGIVVARTGNGAGIAGEAPGAHALVVKVFANQGMNGYGAYTSDVDSAIVWAVQHGARVINLSLGPNIPVVSGALGDQTPQWVQWASQHGAAVAIAAGNTYIPAASYVSMAKDALVVGALGPSGAVASYSQHGVGVNIYAPGGDGPGGDPHSDVISTFPTYALPPANQPLQANVAQGYAAYDGTSFATPYTAGVLAQLMADGYSAAQARQRILDTASGASSGHPSVDAAAALGGCAGGGGSQAGAVSGHSTTFSISSSTTRQTPAPAPSATANASTRPEANGGAEQGLAAPPAAHAPGSSTGSGGGAGVPLLIALAVVVLAGGPAAVALRRRLP
jgi:serine protease